MTDKNYNISKIYSPKDDRFTGMCVTLLYGSVDSINLNIEYDELKMQLNTNSVDAEETIVMFENKISIVNNYTGNDSYELCCTLFNIDNIQNAQDQLSDHQNSGNSHIDDINKKILSGNLAHWSKIKNSLSEYYQENNLNELKNILVEYFNTYIDHVKSKKLFVIE